MSMSKFKIYSLSFTLLDENLLYKHYEKMNIAHQEQIFQFFIIIISKR